MQSSSDAAERRSDSGAMPYVSLPASPTLTNPDMILPDYDDNAVSLDHPQSPLMWKNAHAGNLGFDLSTEAFTAGPITPTTPIIYGNGTMLSDIGEVTEVESTCGPSRSRSGSTRSELAIVTSTALPYEAIRQKIKQSRMAHQRHMSVESNSTVTAHDQTGLFADFDDTVSIDDSNFQGDDEDSVADSYIDDGSVQETISPAKESFDPNDARYSTTLSRRAEQILANAKRRLTVSAQISNVVEIVLNVGRQWKATLIGPDHHFTLRRGPQWALIQHPRRPSEDLLPLSVLAMIMAMGSYLMAIIGYLARVIS